MDIERWLRALGLEQYEPAFRENKIDGKIISKLTPEDLKDLGVALVGDRRRLLEAIAALRAEPEPSSERIASDEAISKRERGGLTRNAERRQLTVMFVDLVGSTALSARLDPEDVREIIAAYHRCCAEEISRAAGFVAKYMGDGVLAYFGYPQAHEDDAERAVRTGLGLVAAVPRLRSRHEATLQVRIGIATGLVVVGDLIGEGAAQEQGVVGGTPNVAARLQALAEPGQLVISQSTRHLAGGLFDYGDLGRIALKGLTEPLQAWRVLGPSTVESRFEAHRGAALTPLVGREEELQLMLRRWQQAKTGDGSVVLISGEPGIGKSRLAETLLERLSGEPHTRLRTFCSPQHGDTALYPTITQLERAAGFRREDTAEQRLDKLAALLARATNDLSASIPLLAAVLSIPTAERYPVLDLTPQKRKERTLKALAAQVEGLAARQPVLMIFEDAHWSDPTSLELLDLIVDRVPNLPVLLIVTYRTEFAPPWVGRSHVTALILNRLPPRQRAEMIARVTEGKKLPKAIADQIAERTDGIPLFIEELTKAVVESGDLADAGDHHTGTSSLSPIAIPTTLQASLLARLDRLGPVREVAQIAAALGRHFSHELISAVSPIPQKQLDDALAQLIGAELILCRGTPPDAEYTFKHALVQDAAYSTLLRARRQQLHGRIAEALEHRFPEIVAPQPALLAHHHTEAGQGEKAVGYRLKAGQQAVARSAMTEAVAQLRKGLDVLAGLPDNPARAQQELDLQIALGRALMAIRGYSAPMVAETIARARGLAEQCDRPQDLVRLLYFQRVFHTSRGEHKLAHSLAEQMEKIGEARRDEVTQLLAYYLRAQSCFHLGELVSARALRERCRGLSDPAHRTACAAVTVEDPFIVNRAWLGATLAMLGYVDQGRVETDAALSEAHRLGHAYTIAWVLLLACWVEAIVGAPCGLLRHAEELLTVSEEYGFPHMLGQGLYNRGRALVALGQAREGLTLITKALSGRRAIGSLVDTPRVLCFLAEAHAKIEQLDEGLTCLTEAERSEERTWEAEVCRVRGDLLHATGDRSAAEQSYCQAVAVAKRQSAKPFELRASTSLARLWRDEGKRTEARELLAPICGWFTEGFDTLDLKEAKALLDELR